MDPITLETEIDATLEHVWKCFNQPEHVTQWNFAADDWHCPKASNNVIAGGEFNYTMAAKDGSFEFDFQGTYKEVTPLKELKIVLGDGRNMEVTFTQMGEKTKVTETFDPENENPREMQQMGWQMILNNFKKYAEASL
jgi:uncharacterized protein YndB with AHSA1/START domain